MFYKLMAILISLFLISCNGEQDTKNLDNKDNQIENQDESINSTNKSFQNNQIVGLETNIDVNKDENNQIESKSIKSDSLGYFLPKSVPGTKPNAFRYGTVMLEEEYMTKASREYVFSNGGSLIFSVADYYSKSNIPKIQMKRFNRLPIIPGKKVNEIAIPDAKGYSIVDENTNEATLFLLLKDRFILRIDAYNIPDKNYFLQDYLKYFNIDGLRKIK